MSPPRKINPLTIKELNEQGLTTTQIAERLGIAYNSAQYIQRSVLKIPINRAAVQKKSTENFSCVKVPDAGVSAVLLPEPTLSSAMLHLSRFDSVLRNIVLRQKNGGEAFTPPPSHSAARSIQPNLNFHTQRPVGRSGR